MDFFIAGFTNNIPSSIVYGSRLTSTNNAEKLQRKEKPITVIKHQPGKDHVMPQFNITIHVFIKRDVLNPAEIPTLQALLDLDITSVSAIKMGKCFIISLGAVNKDTAEAYAAEMCAKLLVNPVVEYFNIDNVEEIAPATAA